MLAAEASGYLATPKLMPGRLTGATPAPQPRLVAKVELTAGTPQQSELYDAIPRRHTNRNPYDPSKPLSGDFVEKVRTVTSAEPDVRIFLFTDEKERKRIAGMISQANDVLHGDPVVEHGSEEWMRLRWKSVQENRDGLTVDTFGLPSSQAMVANMIPAPVLRRLVASAKHTYRKLLLTLRYLDGSPSVIAMIRNRACAPEESGSGHICSRRRAAPRDVPRMRPWK
jgi:hypothetical protein